MKKILTGAGICFTAVAIVAFLSGISPQIADAASLGPNNPGTGASVAAGGNPWVNPGNITSSDNVYATGDYSSGSDSDWLKATNFGFSIPTGATINGITVEIEKHYTGSQAGDGAVQLVKGGVISGSNRGSVSGWPAADAYTTYGSASDLWGLTWTPADVNDSTFGAAILATSFGGSAGTGFVDHIRITVTYTAASSATSITSDATIFE